VTAVFTGIFMMTEMKAKARINTKAKINIKARAKTDSCTILRSY
jgi:hypothetical protein